MNQLVQTPTPEDERPRLGTALAIAAASFMLGIAAVTALPAQPKPRVKALSAAHTTVRETPPRAATTPSGSDTGRAANAPQQEQPLAPVPHAAAIASPVIPDQTTDEGTATLEDAPPAAPPERNNLTMIQGRVAYLRCDGLRNEHGRFPCPRDAALEQSVWDVLNTLPRCAPSLGRGGVDVRLDLVRGERTQVRVLPIAGSPEPSLDDDQVYACVGARLARISTSLDPIYMMVSFRAVLR